MIAIKINNKEQEIEEGISLSQLLDSLSVSTNGIAIAVNLSILKYADWSSFTPKNGDQILIIKATQGG